MTEKHILHIRALWCKYLPAIKILIKKSAAGEQLLGINRSDFDKASGLRKSGCRFVINFTGNKPDRLFNNNSFAHSFILNLQSDKTISELLSAYNYSFVFTNKYQLRIKNNGIFERAAQSIS